MATFAEVKGHNRDLIRKVLEMSIFVKPHEDGDEEITQVWDGTGLVVPPGYVSVGLVTKGDGASWTRDQSTSDTESMGYAEPTRRDITSDVNGQIGRATCRERKKVTALSQVEATEKSTHRPQECT